MSFRCFYYLKKIERERENLFFNKSQITYKIRALTILHTLIIYIRETFFLTYDMNN